MECELNRIYKGEDYTIGELYIDGVFICHTLEDKVRILNSYEDKVYGETAIPIGRYKVVLSYSNRFKRILPEILNVDFFKGIRIHEGNYADYKTFLKTINIPKDKPKFISEENIKVI